MIINTIRPWIPGIFLVFFMALPSMLWGQNTYVPDDNFEQALIDLGYDDVIDDFVLTENISGVYELDVANKEISDLTGIEDFTSLIFLECSGNQLYNLDVSNNTSLIDLRCYSNNSLYSLDVSNNTSLRILDCRANGLSILDLSYNTLLENLACSQNYLTSLDLSNNPVLIELNFYQNNLTSIDLSNNTILDRLACELNNLTTLDLSNNTNLTELTCYNNQLFHLNMKNGVTDQLSTFNATGNSLDCIEVDEEDVDWATENWTYENGNIKIAELVFSTTSIVSSTLDFLPECEMLDPDDNLIEIKGFAQGVVNVQ